MDCAEVRAYITEYIDGVLSEEKRAQVEAHFACCAECKKEAEAQLLLRSELKALRLEDTSDFVFDMESAKKPAVLPLYKQRWVRAMSVAAACFVLFVGVLAVTQNGYQTPQDSEVKMLENEMADEAEAKTAEVTNDAVEFSGKARARTATVPYADTDLTVPDSYSYYSSVEPRVVQDYEAENEKESSAIAPVAETEQSVAAPSAPVADKSDDASSAQAPASGGGSGNPMQIYYKRIVRLSVSAEAQERFLQVMSGIHDDSFSDVMVVSEGDLPQLLAIDGVFLVSESTVETQASYYRGKVIVHY